MEADPMQLFACYRTDAWNHADLHRSQELKFLARFDDRPAIGLGSLGGHLGDEFRRGNTDRCSQAIGGCADVLLQLLDQQLQARSAEIDSSASCAEIDEGLVQGQRLHKW